MKNNKGITLIALVITIIVLIILAGISISILMGQEGLITRAKQGAQNYQNAAIEEQQVLNELYSGEIIEGHNVVSNTTSNSFKIPQLNFYAEGDGSKTSAFGYPDLKFDVKQYKKLNIDSISFGSVWYYSQDLIIYGIDENNTKTIIYDKSNIQTATTFNSIEIDISSYDLVEFSLKTYINYTEGYPARTSNGQITLNNVIFS